MNLRFSEGAVRVRLSATEFDRLLGGAHLRLDLPLGIADRAVRLHSCTGFDALADAEGLLILVAADALAALAARLPCRDGIAFTAHPGGMPLAISLEVDVRGSGGAHRHGTALR